MLNRKKYKANDLAKEAVKASIRTKAFVAICQDALKEYTRLTEFGTSDPNAKALL